MIRRAAVVVMMAAALLLAACSAPEKGIVTKKEYHDPYSWIQMVCGGYDSKGNCTVQTPVVHNEPARWEMCLKDGKDEGCRYVDETTFHQYKVGEYYPRTQ